MTQAMYPKEYIDYLVYFHTDRDFFECHEILEEYWKKDKTSELNQAWVGLIQVAVGLYHHRRNNLRGARKMISSAIANLSIQDLTALGINGVKFHHMLKERLDLLANETAPYTDMDIPIQDEELLQLCINRCTSQQLKWTEPSNMLEESLIHKHSLRDRSDVIEARLKEKARKKMLRDHQKKI